MEARKLNSKGTVSETEGPPAVLPVKHPSVAWANVGGLVSATVREVRGKVAATLSQEGRLLSPKRREGLALVVRVLDYYRKAAEDAQQYEKLFESRAGETWRILNIEWCADLPGYRLQRESMERARKDSRRRHAPAREYCLWVRDGAVVGWGSRTKGSDRDFGRCAVM